MDNLDLASVWLDNVLKLSFIVTPVVEFCLIFTLHVHCFYSVLLKRIIVLVIAC